MILHVDLETYSETDITKAGAYKYVEDPAFRVLLFGYAWNDEPAEVIDLEGARYSGLPPELRRALTDPHVLKVAHNANFERTCLTKYLGDPVPPEQWRCTAAWARALALPGSLGKLTTALGFTDDAKDKAGKSLIKKFCMPGKKAQGDLFGNDWKDFIEYCRQDVNAERAVLKWLEKYPLPESEWRLWALDQEINDRGMPVNLLLVEKILLLESGLRGYYEGRVKKITGCTNPNSRDQLLSWFAGNGKPFRDMTAGAVSEALAGKDLSPPEREVLEIRQQLARSSTAKFEALSRAVCSDSRMKGALLYCGASTGRWAGRIFQPQNLPRPVIRQTEIGPARGLARDASPESWVLSYDDPIGALVSMIRSVIAIDGGLLTVADLSSIESVMAAWVAGSEELVELFRAGRDPYKDFACKLYGVKYEDVTKAQRTFCKPCVLGAQYGMSSGGLRAYASNFGMDMTEPEAKKQLNVWKRAYGVIPETWAAIQEAAMDTIRSGGEHEAGKCLFSKDETFLMIELPSGRKLYYRDPEESRGRFGMELSYLDAQKGRIRTFGARLFENIVQAVARDVLAWGLLQTAKAGLKIIGHVHDEILVEGDNLPELIEAMTSPPPWCPDAPIRAEGYTGPFYRKD